MRSRGRGDGARGRPHHAVTDREMRCDSDLEELASQRGGHYDPFGVPPVAGSGKPTRLRCTFEHPSVPNFNFVFPNAAWSA